MALILIKQFLFFSKQGRDILVTKPGFHQAPVMDQRHFDHWQSHIKLRGHLLADGKILVMQCNPKSGVKSSTCH